MIRPVSLVVAALVLGLALCVAAGAQDTVRWSAPMNQYPNQWAPTPEPPNYQNYYGYNYQYGGYGQGSQAGNWPSWGYQGYGGNAGGYPQQGFSGNPYSYGFY